MATLDTVTKLRADTIKHPFSFLQKATPAEIEALLTSAHAFLQAGVAHNDLVRTKSVLARDAS
jgi:hypothetical protein